MKQIHRLLKDNNLKVNHYEKKGNVYFVRSNGENYAIKKTSNNKKDIYNYLKSRNFNYYPEILNSDEFYEITNVIPSIDYPKEQKMLDLVNLTALLHSKTSFYKEVENDYFKKIYEDIKGNIEYLNSYYTDIITLIEKEIYMKPSSYFLARNIMVIYSSLENSRSLLEQWYELVKEKTKVRFAVLHNNLKLEHFLKNDTSYLISWDNSKIDNPIFDLYKLYLNNSLDCDFSYYLKEYEKKYSLLESERILLFTLISLPNKLEWEKEFETCRIFTKEIDMLYKARKLISSYGEKEEEKK